MTDVCYMCTMLLDRSLIDDLCMLNAHHSLKQKSSGRLTVCVKCAPLKETAVKILAYVTCTPQVWYMYGLFCFAVHGCTQEQPSG